MNGSHGSQVQCDIFLSTANYNCSFLLAPGGVKALEFYINGVGAQEPVRHDAPHRKFCIKGADGGSQRVFTGSP